MLRLNRRFLGAAGAVVAAASLAVAGITAASARSSAVTGIEHFQLVSTSPTASTVPVISYGLFTDYGVDHPGAKVDTVVLQKGGFQVAHSAGVGTHQFNPKTCLFRANLHGTIRLSHGTRAYAGISGSGTYQASVLFIAARSATGKCSSSAPPVAFQQIIKGTASVTLP
jgi:hypothetical protein